MDIFVSIISLVNMFSCHRYPSLRVAFIDEVEEPSKDRPKKINQKVYYSSLVKAALPKSSNTLEPEQNLDQVKIMPLLKDNR